MMLGFVSACVSAVFLFIAYDVVKNLKQKPVLSVVIAALFAGLSYYGFTS